MRIPKHGFRVASVLAAITLLTAACGDSGTTRSDRSGPDLVPTDAAMSSDMTGVADDHDHEHGAVVQVDAADAPTIDLTVTQDATSGWNVYADVGGMTFAPERAGSEHVPGEGHMHIYVDGNKLGRVYTGWYHLDGLAEGEHEVRMTLNANSHADLAIGDEVIGDSVTITVPPVTEAAEHLHAENLQAGEPMSVSLRVEPDPVAGWNAFVTTTGFTFAPENASTAHVDGEGHAHLYVDGRKIARLYGEAFHFTVDQPGTHEVKVSLNGNTHAPYESGGSPVEAVATIDVTGPVAAPDRVIEIAVHEGGVDGGGRHEVAVGDVVKIVVSGHQVDQVHVHGYDIYGALTHDGPAEVIFTADVPGIWEVELESAGIMLAELAVS